MTGLVIRKSSEFLVAKNRVGPVWTWWLTLRLTTWAQKRRLARWGTSCVCHTGQNKIFTIAVTAHLDHVFQAIDTKHVFNTNPYSGVETNPDMSEQDTVVDFEFTPFTLFLMQWYSPWWRHVEPQFASEASRGRSRTLIILPWQRLGLSSTVQLPVTQLISVSWCSQRA